MFLKSVVCSTDSSFIKILIRRGAQHWLSSIYTNLRPCLPLTTSKTGRLLIHVSIRDDCKFFQGLKISFSIRVESKAGNPLKQAGKYNLAIQRSKRVQTKGREMNGIQR